MYQIDGGDEVIPLADTPAPAVPPNPVVLAGDFDLFLTYRAAPGTGLVLIDFENPAAHYFGGPNDEALGGHPLRARGLDYYAAFEVYNSSWIRALERMNRVHPRHDPRRFVGLRHFIFTFQDETFECVARGLQILAQVSNRAENAKAIFDTMTARVMSPLD
jgi:hypothetical protein